MDKEIKILTDAGVHYTFENPNDDPTFQRFSYETFHLMRSCGGIMTIFVQRDDKSAKENFLALINKWNKIGNPLWVYIAK